VQQEIRAEDWSRPWGEQPPPAPASASRRDRSRIRSAWSLWSPFRPYYRRDGPAVTVWIDLKGNGAMGQATAATDEKAAWLALLDCVEAYYLMLRRGSLTGRALAWVGRRWITPKN
jgi:hypothetical protein